MPHRISRFWYELKDRRVIRTTTVYVAGAFGLLELIDIISGPLGFPGWVLSVFFFICVLGFPLVLLFSWFFYFSPDGIKRYKKQEALYLPEPTEDQEGMLLFEIDSVAGEESREAAKGSGNIIGISSFAVICLVVALFLFHSTGSVHFNEKDLVVLADFVNLTEEQIFDHSLNTAFEISIDQSHHVNVVPDRRKKEVLKRIGKESDTIIDEELCREIALREGAKAYITPEISRVGKQYILSSKLQDTGNGELIASIHYYCDDQDDILGTLDRMCKQIRRHLGESRYKMSGQKKPLAEVTTSSLDALKQYSLGQEYMAEMDYEQAVAHLRMAIGLDSSFATAKASLGSLLCEFYDREEGKRWLNEAITSIDHMTDSEKYGILAVYAVHVEKDLDKSNTYTRILIELFPERAGYRTNLGLNFTDQGRFQEAVAEFKHAVRIDPDAIGPYASLSNLYNTQLRQIDSAMYWAQGMIDIAPESPWGHFYLGVCYVEIDALEKARDEFEKVKGLSPSISVNLYNLALTYHALEEFELAIDVLNDIIETWPETLIAHYYLGICFERMRADGRARWHYEDYLSKLDSIEVASPDHPGLLMDKGRVLTRLGRIEEGMETGKRGFELDSSYQYSFAKLLVLQANPERALHHLEQAFSKGYRSLFQIKIDPDLSSLRDDERFLQLIAQYLE